MRSKAKNVSTLFTRTNQLKEIVDLINAGKQTEAVTLYSETFKVTHEEAHAAVNRLASGLSLAMNHIQVQGFSVSNDPNIQTYRSSDNTGRSIGCIILAIVLFTFGIIAVTTIIPLIAGGVAFSSIFSSDDPLASIGEALSTLEAGSESSEPGGIIPPFSTATPVISASPTPGAGSLLQQFGTEGISPGQFNDARTLAIAPDGTIYVADRNSGRLQYFNAEGVYQGQWQMDDEKYIDSMVIDRSGHLFTIETSDIFRYDLATGEQQTQYTYPGTAVSFSGIATTVDNQLIAINRIRGEIIRFDTNGNSTLLVQVENVPDASGFEDLTVDGGGNIYVLGTGEDALGNRQDVVFKFNSDGQYLTRFGQTGSEPGTFRAPNSLVVDGQGRVYVGDIFGIHIFNNNGGFIDFIKGDGSTFDMQFNDQGELLVTNRTTLFRYGINVK
jgi:sugar lactone lactonase YvrE